MSRLDTPVPDGSASEPAGLRDSPLKAKFVNGKIVLPARGTGLGLSDVGTAVWSMVVALNEYCRTSKNVQKEIKGTLSELSYWTEQLNSRTQKAAAEAVKASARIVSLEDSLKKETQARGGMITERDAALKETATLGIQLQVLKRREAQIGRRRTCTALANILAEDEVDLFEAELVLKQRWHADEFVATTTEREPLPAGGGITRALLIDHTRVKTSPLVTSLEKGIPGMSAVLAKGLPKPGHAVVLRNESACVLDGEETVISCDTFFMLGIDNGDQLSSLFGALRQLKDQLGDQTVAMTSTALIPAATVRKACEAIFMGSTGKVVLHLGGKTVPSSKGQQSHVSESATPAQNRVRSRPDDIVV